MSPVRVLLPLVGLLCACQTPGEPAEPPTPAGPERIASAVTVYNGGRALVKDTRRFDLDAGVNHVRFDEVTSGIVPASVHVEAVDGDPLAVVEQNYEYDLVSTQRLLERYVGQAIEVTTEDGQQYAGTLLAGNQDVILDTGDGGVVVLRLDAIRDYGFPELPDGLASRPSLAWSLDSGRAGERDVTVTYLSTGFGWSADYIVQLADSDDAVDVSGWVTVDNGSEATFRDARLKLVAGDVNLLPVATAQAELADASTRGSGMAGGARQVQQRQFFDYHLYEIPEPVTLGARETKQVEFVQVDGVPAEVSYEVQFDGSWWGTTISRHPSVTVSFVNGADQGLGVPIPEGAVRVYQQDVDGAAELVGESRIGHTPKDETIELTVGQAFDLVAEWKQTRHRVISDWVDQFDYEAVVRNHKAEPVTVTLKHQPYLWGDWRVLRSSVEADRSDNATAEFTLEIPADGEVTLTYTVRTRW